MIISDGTQLRGFGAFRGSLRGFGTPVDDAKNALLDLNDKLYAALDSTSLGWSARSTAQRQVDDWHQTALTWMNIAGESDPSKAAGLQAVGAKLINTASDITDYINDESLTSYVLYVGQNLPSLLKSAASWTIQTTSDLSQQTEREAADLAKNAANDAGEIAKKAAWTTTEILLAVGGSAVLLIFLARKSGLKLNLPFVSI